MTEQAQPLSAILIEMSAQALISWTEKTALRGASREELAVRGMDFVTALHGNLVLLRDCLQETVEDIQMHSVDLEAKLDELYSRLTVDELELYNRLKGLEPDPPEPPFLKDN